MRFLRQSLTGLFLLSLTAALLFVAVGMVKDALTERFAEEPRQRQQRERVFTVNVATATAEQVTPEISVFGEIQSQRTLELRAASGGMITEIAPEFREGGQVKAGQVLVQIETTDAQDALSRATSDLRLLESEKQDGIVNLAIAKDELAVASKQLALRTAALARQKELRSNGISSVSAIETAELNVISAQQQELTRRKAIAAAEATLAQTETQLESATIAVAEVQRNLADLTIAADFDGTLAEVSAIPGGLVSSNEHLGQLIDPNSLEVAFRVSTAQYARLLDRSGALREAAVTVNLSASGFDLTAKGTISRDSAVVGDGQTGRLLFASLSQARGLKPGDFVSVSIAERAIDNLVRLPAAALDAQGRIMVISEDDRLEAVPVTLVRRQGDAVLVEAGPFVGREVVTRLTPLLGAGIRVKPVRETAEGEPKIAAAPPEPEVIDLTEERRAKLIAFVQANQRMPADRKQRVIDQLGQPQVPAQVVNRLEQRMGG